ncbi:MAG: hypothetical protein ACP5IO_06330 [Elusimicrobiales bacterium]
MLSEKLMMAVRILRKEKIAEEGKKCREGLLRILILKILILLKRLKISFTRSKELFY